MAEHKVPQDVEADDKLLGPLSFRQFIYAMIALAAAALAYFLATSPVKPLLVVPLPIFLVFGVLAIPRKGQPMEVYLGALIHFYFQSTRRLWDPDGQENLVEITNPTIDTAPQADKVGGAEAASRLSFLADVEDSQGWSTRGNVNLTDDFALAANTATDVFDDSSLNQAFSDRLAQTEQQARDEAIARMSTPEPAPVLTPVIPAVQPAPTVQGGFAPPTYAPSAAPVIVTPPPVPAATPAPTVTVEDEAAISAMLKQSAASPMTAFHQTVVQPLGSSPVASNPTLTTTAAPVVPAPVPTPVPMPTPSPVPAPPPPPPPAPAPIPPPAPPLPEPEPPKPAAPATTTPESATIVSEDLGEEVISHDAGSDNSNQGGEISLH
jgi:hypothetical protein